MRAPESRCTRCCPDQTCGPTGAKGSDGPGERLTLLRALAHVARVPQGQAWDTPPTRHTGPETVFPQVRLSVRGGAEGIRTPDLLIANETRYQLRHSPIASTTVNRRETLASAGSRAESDERQPLTARRGSSDAFPTSAACSPWTAAAAAVWLSCSLCPEDQVPGSPSSIVRIVRRAAGLPT